MNDRFVEDLKSRTDIVDIVRKYAELKKSGKNYMCRSPFRNERTPSFCVSPDQQFWYDFGSSEGGDVISFLERIENISFREALEMLSDMAGVEMPQFFGNAGPTREQKKDILTLHAKAQEYFMLQLSQNIKAQEYLKNRGISQSLIDDWGIGYGGDVSDGLTKFLLKNGFSQSDIAESGVAFEREFGDQTMKDRFSRRIIIPVREPRNGGIIAFTGREIHGEKGAKYINSPENPVYQKSATLFGLDRARLPIRDRDKVILVEGNFDVISAHGKGFISTVATCGTSLTEDHLRLLQRMTQNIYLAFDSDMAGKKATLRAVEMCLKQGLNPFVIDIVDGNDFDDLAQKNPDILQKSVDSALPALIFLLDRFSKKFLNGSVEGEQKFLDTFFVFVQSIQRPIILEDILEKIAHKINRPLSLIHQEFELFCRKNKTTPKEKSVADTKSIVFTRSESFVGFLIAHWDFFGEKMNTKILELLSGIEKDILKKILDKIPLSEEEKTQLLAWQLSQELLYQEHPSPERLKQDFKSFVDKLKSVQQKQKFLDEVARFKNPQET